VTFSLVRYGLMVGPAWWPFGRVDGQGLSGRIRVSLLAAVVVGGILVQLIWLNWFFVITPNNRGIP
jgi:hypothetical protein